MRTFVACLLIILLWAPAAVQAQEKPPTGPVILTVAGGIDKANRGASTAFDDAFFKHHEIVFKQAYAFDIAALEALGTEKIKITYPTWPGPSEFEGPLLRDVLRAAGATGRTVKVFALDGYGAEIPVTDTLSYPVMLAIKRNGRYLGIGDRGPTWVVYPRNDHPALANRDDSNWVWSAFYIEVR